MRYVDDAFGTCTVSFSATWSCLLCGGEAVAEDARAMIDTLSVCSVVDPGCYQPYPILGALMYLTRHWMGDLQCGENITQRL